MSWVESLCCGCCRHVGGGVIVLRVASTCCGWSHRVVGGVTVLSACQGWSQSKCINNALSINTSYRQKHFVGGTHQL